jgi:hypothetical protein
LQTDNYETYINWDDPKEKPDDGSGSIFGSILYIVFIIFIAVVVLGLIALVVFGAIKLYKQRMAKKKGIPGSDANYVLMETE